jgi:hypothetical protein
MSMTNYRQFMLKPNTKWIAPLRSRGYGKAHLFLPGGKKSECGLATLEDAQKPSSRHVRSNGDLYILDPCEYCTNRAIDLGIGPGGLSKNE